MQELKKVDPLSAGKICGIMYTIMGVVIGLIYALYFAGMGLLVTSMSGTEGTLMIIIGVVCIVAVPIIYGIIGFLSGLIGAAIYNLLARKIGGIKLEIK